MSDKDKRELKNQKHFSVRIAVFSFATIFMFGSIYISRVALSPIASVPSNNRLAENYLIPTPSIEQESVEISTSSAVLGVNQEAPCIVTVFNKKYDLSTFIKTDTDKSVFECGADVSKKYLNVYGKDLKIIFKYEIDQKGDLINQE